MQPGTETLRVSPGVRGRAVAEGGSHDYYLIAVGLIGVLAVWIRPLTSSLWLDETGTFWVIQGGVRDVVHRALDFQGQFPLYHVALWGWSRLAGTSELALRAPSLLGALVATWLCFRLALRLFDDVAVARLAACVFVLLPPVAFAAGDARPYALALAALLGATLALVRWFRSQRPRDLIAYVVLTALTLYLHYLFALVLVAHALLAAGPVRRMGRRGAVAVGAAVAGLALLLLPGVPHFVDVLGRRQAMSLFTFGSVLDVLAWVAPPMIVVAVLVGWVVRLPPAPPTLRAGEVPRRLLAFLGVWLVVPPLAIFVAGRMSGIGLYAQRHFLSSIPALALLAAVAAALLLSPRRQRVAMVVLAMMFVVTCSSSEHIHSDWRGAAQAADSLSDPTTPVLVYAGFSESNQMGWITDEERAQLFLAPLAAYPVRGEQYPLPYELTDAAKAYVDGILASAADADRIILLTSELTLSYDVWLEERTSRLGYTTSIVGQFDDVRVVVFQR